MNADYNLGAEIVDQTMYRVLPPLYDSRDARVMLIAIGAQESLFLHREQIGGPARGFWQFEKGGGVTEVLQHRSTRRMAEAVCDIRGTYPHSNAVYESLASDDSLACAFARLLLWTDSDPLPHDDADAGWEYYLRNWRPGKPHPIPWVDHYAAAQKVVA